jgi:D-inositol-3-phosphate glycosyltransferase
MISDQTGIPLIHTMHTTARVKNLNLATGEKPEPQIRAIGEEQVVAAATGLIANTDAEAASLVSLYSACPDKVFVVAPGVDLNTYNPADGKAGARRRLDITPDAIMLTFVGRIQAHKGPDVLLRAAAQMLDHTPYLRSKLAVVIVGGTSGAGANELENLKGLAKFLKIEDVVHFIAPVAHAQLADWYRASDLICMPSYSESFGLVALEAQACGTPVVATAVGGLRTAVSDGISGALIDGHNPMAWATVILKIISDPRRSVQLSISSLEHASKFGWQVTANRTLKIYDDLIGIQSKSSFIPRFLG